MLMKQEGRICHKPGHAPDPIKKDHTTARNVDTLKYRENPAAMGLLVR